LVDAAVVYPKAKIPTVELPAEEPLEDATLAAVAEELRHPEYVYLSRVVDATEGTQPKAKILTIAVPVAEPFWDAALAAVVEALVQPEYVYLLRVVDPTPDTRPNAKIASVPKDKPAVGHTPAFCHASIWSIVHMPGAVPHWNGPVGVAGLLVIMPPEYVRDIRH